MGGGSNIKQFEYMLLTLSPSSSHALTTSLNSMGKQGWELVTINENFWIFKRELPKRYIGGPR